MYKMWTGNAFLQNRFPSHPMSAAFTLPPRPDGQIGHQRGSKIRYLSLCQAKSAVRFWLALELKDLTFAALWQLVLMQTASRTSPDGTGIGIAQECTS